jgi:hypothetical protein
LRGPLCQRHMARTVRSAKPSVESSIKAPK